MSEAVLGKMSGREAERSERLNKTRAGHFGNAPKKEETQNNSGVTDNGRRFFGRSNRRKAAAKSEENTDATSVRKLPFAMAFMAAALKDIFDLIIIALEAAAGLSVVLAPLAAVGIAFGGVLTWCISIFIGLMLILAGQGGKRGRAQKIAARLIKRGVVLGGFTLIESMPGLAVFPMEVFMVFLLYKMTVREQRSDIIK